MLEFFFHVTASVKNLSIIQKPKTHSFFSSELSALTLHPEVEKNICPQSLQKYFAYGFVPHPRTIYQHINKLPGGYNLNYNLKTNTYTTEKYWSYVLSPDKSLLKRDSRELNEKTEELLKKAVKRRLQADVDLGILLSGGIDSSAIAAFASREKNSLKTFSIGFTSSSYDESTYSSKVARMIKSDHTLQKLDIDQTIKLLPDLLQRIDEPQGDDSLLPTYLVCKLAKEKVKVALGGDGGDELFCGYEPFRFWRWARRYNLYLPGITHQAVNKLINLIPASNQYMALSLKLKRFFHASSLKMKVWVPALLAPLQLKEIIELTNIETNLEDLYSEAIVSWENCHSNWAGDKINQYYVDYYLQDEILAKTDRASMLNSLELRAPFLDCELADFTRTLPWQLKVRMGTTKYILKQALRNILPDDILFRGKQGFSPPAAAWFQKERLQINQFKTSLLNSQAAEKFFQKHRQQTDDHRRFLWNQFALENFIKANNHAHN